MLNYRTYILFLIFLLCITQQSKTFAQSSFWEPTSGPLGGYVTAIAASENHVYASVWNRLYHSSDYGNSWEQTTLLSNFTISSITIHNEEVFVSTEESDIWVTGPSYRSIDYGKTWIELPIQVFFIGDCVINDEQVIFAASSWILLRSVDHGITWTTLVYGDHFPVGALLSSVALDKNGVLFLGTLDSGMFCSTDNGDSWKRAGLTEVEISSFVISSQGKIIAASPDSGIYQSTDSGESWKSLGLKNTLAKSVVVNRNGDIFVATDRQGIYRTDDDGKHWSLINSDLMTYTPILAIDKHDNVYASTRGGGVYRLSSHDCIWSQIGLSTVEVLSLTVNNNGDIFAGTYWGGIFHSTNNGNTWVHRINGLTNVFFQALAVDNNGTVFAGAVNNNGGIYRSTNNGTSWTELHEGLEIQDPWWNRPSVLSFAINKSNHIFSATYHGLFRSTNSGDSWQRLVDSLPSGIVHSVTVHPNGDLFVSHNGVMRSSDNGESWEKLDFSFGRTVTHLTVDGNGYIFAGTEGSGIYRSIDSSKSWTAVNGGLMNFHVRTILADPSGVLYAGTRGHVHTSTDNGDSWIELGVGAPPYDVKALAINNDGYLFAGSGGPVYRSRNPITPIEPATTQIPTSFSLHQNYPNPFNPATTIRYSLPSAQFVTIKVIDIMGRELTTLTNEFKQAGTHTTTFDATAYPSGVYFYRFTAGTFSETKKLLLLK